MIFFDTWVWMTLAQRDAPCHKDMLAFYQKLKLEKNIPVTTNLVLMETLTQLGRIISPQYAAVFVESLFKEVEAKELFIVEINEKRYKRALQMLRMCRKKAFIPFIDFTSFVVMKELGISEILTTNRNYAVKGLGVRKLVDLSCELLSIVPATEMAHAGQ